MTPRPTTSSDDAFGEFGGRHVPEPLEAPLEQLAGAYDEIEESEAFRDLSEAEGIIPALETSHALAKQLAAEGAPETILVNLSGRGDKDMEQAAELFDLG